jgi:glycerate kinase
MNRIMNILIAPNAYKNSLSAAAAAESIRDGILQSKLKCTCECFPVGDGGDGTAELIIQHFNGHTITVDVHDPLGRKIRSSFGLIDKDNTAVIEMADASGLRLLNANELAPLCASTYGTGELIKAALDCHVKKIIIGIGGSATVDGAVGLLQALGVRFLDASGKILSNLPERLVELVEIDLSGLDKRILQCELVVLCDVENTLLGENGAASIFGPQKGATADQVKKLETALTKFRDITFQKIGYDMAAIKHGGAAGGTAAGVAAYLQAKLVNGIDYFLEITGFDDQLQKADIVITGEGSIDSQTLLGKGPFGVARDAKKKNIPVIGFAGKVPATYDIKLQEYFDSLIAIGHGATDLATALQSTGADLQRTAREVGNLLAIQSLQNQKNQ